jgi:hypothetical protein
MGYRIFSLFSGMVVSSNVWHDIMGHMFGDRFARWYTRPNSAPRLWNAVLYRWWYRLRPDVVESIDTDAFGPLVVRHAHVQTADAIRSEWSGWAELGLDVVAGFIFVSEFIPFLVNAAYESPTVARQALETASGLVPGLTTMYFLDTNPNAVPGPIQHGLINLAWAGLGLGSMGVSAFNIISAIRGAGRGLDNLGVTPASVTAAAAAAARAAMDVANAADTSLYSRGRSYSGVGRAGTAAPAAAPARERHSSIRMGLVVAFIFLVLKEFAEMLVRSWSVRGFGKPALLANGKNDKKSQ